MKNRIAALVFMVLFTSSCLMALTPTEQAFMQDLNDRAQAERVNLEQLYLAVPLAADQYGLREQNRSNLRNLIAQVYLMLNYNPGAALLTPEMQNALNEFINRTEQYLREEAGRNFSRRPSQEIRNRLSARGRALNLFPVAADQLISH